MTRATILQEVRQMRFEELYERRQRRDVTMADSSGDAGGHGADVSTVGVRYDAEGVEEC